jgi:hypothetical protein
MKSTALLLLAMTVGGSTVALAQVTHKCAPHEVHRETYSDESSEVLAVAMRSKVKLSPEWNDAQILSAFGFTNATAANGEQGIDGIQATYHAGKTMITIVRSVSTGLVIRITRGRHAGYWIVEPCN